MKTNVREPETWKRVIEIEIPKEKVQSAFDEKLGKYRREMKLPGFRPGKVPEALIRQRYGSAIKAEIVDDLIKTSYRDVCTERSIDPVSEARVSEIKAEDGDDLKFSIETEVDPPIEIKGYDRLKVKASPRKVKDGEVDEAIKNLQDRLAQFKDIDRPAKKGDHIRFQYLKAVVDGEERADIKSPTYPVELGGENRVKDFDKGMIGHSAGETVDITVKFPKDYPDQQVAGKSGEFQVKIDAIQEKVLPEINEEFLKKIGDFADEAALREDVRKHLEQEELQRARNEAYNEAIDKLIKDNEFEVPPARVKQFAEYMYAEATRYQTPDQAPPTREEIEERYHDVAVRSIKRHRIIDYVAQKENLKATQEEVDREIAKLAAMYNQQFETLKQTLRKNGTTNRIRSDIRERKTLDFLIGELPPEPKE